MTGAPERLGEAKRGFVRELGLLEGFHLQLLLFRNEEMFEYLPMVLRLILLCGSYGSYGFFCPMGLI